MSIILKWSWIEQATRSLISSLIYHDADIWERGTFRTHWDSQHTQLHHFGSGEPVDARCNSPTLSKVNCQVVLCQHFILGVFFFEEITEHGSVSCSVRDHVSMTCSSHFLCRNYSKDRSLLRPFWSRLVRSLIFMNPWTC